MSFFFKNSPVRNAILQKHVVEKYGKELSLLLDRRTRWNSAETMVERILQLYDPIKSALIDLDLIEKFFTQNEFLLLQELLATLRPVRMAVEKLSSREANLLTSEGVLQFVFDELKSYMSVGNINISKEVYEALKFRIDQRRNKEIVSVMKYLQNKHLESTEELPVTTKKNVTKLIIELAEKHFGAEMQSDVNDDDTGTVADQNGEQYFF